MEVRSSSFFPFPSVREGQREFMADVKHAVEAGGILVAHAPTGIGKTVAALVPALQYAIENEKTVFFLTSKRSQHKIAIDTLRLIKEQERNGLNLTAVDITSKQSMCPRAVSIYREFYSLFNEFCRNEQRNKRCWYYMNHDADALARIRSEIMHVEELCEWCKTRQVCPYKAALEVGKSADVIVCDYNHLFSRDIASKMLEKIEKNLDELIVIVDEAHNLPDRIRNNLSSELRLKTISETARGIRNIDRELYNNLLQMEMILKKLVTNAAKAKRAEITVDRDFLIGELEKMLRRRIEVLSYKEFINAIRSRAEAIHASTSRSMPMSMSMSMSTGGESETRKERDILQSNLASISDFLDAWTTEEKCLRILSINDNPTLSLKLLDPSVLSEPVFRRAHASIMMSGTLYPVEMYADVLGATRVNGREIILREYKSPFPRENRLIAVTRGLTTKYTKRGEAMYRRIGEKIEAIAENVRGGMAVFFPSYALLKAILAYLSPQIRRRVMVERREMGKMERNRLYEQLRDEESGILFAVQGGSFSEGMDYESNTLKAIIVVGLPLSPPTLEVKATQGYYTGKYGADKGRLYGYLYPAITKVLQAAGRGIRSEHDRCIIVLMDYRFAQFPYKRCLPPDFDMIFTDRVEDLCRSFFNSGSETN